MKLFGTTQEIAKKAVQNGDVTACVFGLGRMGLPLSLCLAEAGAHVIGVDVNLERVHAIQSGDNLFPEEPGLDALLEKHRQSGRFSATTDAALATRKADVHVILVPTTMGREAHDDQSPLKAAAEHIARGLTRGDIVITECTVPPGTTDALLPILEKSGLRAGKDFGVAHCPERTMSGTAIRDIQHQYPKIVGANDAATRSAVAGFYSAVTSNRVVVLESAKEAECVKVFEGIYRFVNIGLANELAIVSEANGVNAWSVFAAANTQPFCHLHNPGPGVGGHCIPEYPKFVASADTPVINAAQAANEKMAPHAVQLLERKIGNLRGKTIGVLGLTFRPYVKAFENTPAQSIIRALKQKGASVKALDPLCGEDEYRRFDVAKLNHLADADAVLVVNRDEKFSQLPWPSIAGRVVVDACGLFQGNALQRHGIHQVSLGIGKT